MHGNGNEKSNRCTGKASSRLSLPVASSGGAPPKPSMWDASLCGGFYLQAGALSREAWGGEEWKEPGSLRERERRECEQGAGEGAGGVAPVHGRLLQQRGYLLAAGLPHRTVNERACSLSYLFLGGSFY